MDDFNRGDFDAIRAHFTLDAVIQGVLGQAPIAAATDIWRELRAAYGLHLILEALAAEGDVVAARYIERGAFTAPFRGQAPTGCRCEAVAMEWFRVRDGRGAHDSAAISRQPRVG